MRAQVRKARGSGHGSRSHSHGMYHLPRAHARAHARARDGTPRATLRLAASQARRLAEPSPQSWRAAVAESRAPCPCQEELRTALDPRSSEQLAGLPHAGATGSSAAAQPQNELAPPGGGLPPPFRAKQPSVHPHHRLQPPPVRTLQLNRRRCSPLSQTTLGTVETRLPAMPQSAFC